MLQELTTAERYRNFAVLVARAESPLYEHLTAGVATDREVLGFLDGLSFEKRHPQLLLASVRHLGGPLETYDSMRAWVLGHRRELARTMLSRRVQANEVGRCAPVLPVLAALPQPLALLEVGAAAGLCLFPDRYQYEFGPHRVGPPSSSVRLRCPVGGDPPLPADVPTVVWRAGIDLDPLDLQDPDDVAWLEALCWVGHSERTATLQAAVAIARREPPLMVRGDLNERLSEVAGLAPPEATLVVLDSAVLSYVDPPDRERFVRQVRQLGAHWISQELPFVLPEIAARVPPVAAVRQAVYIVALDGEPVAFAPMHGDWLDWFGS